MKRREFLDSTGLIAALSVTGSLVSPQPGQAAEQPARSFAEDTRARPRPEGEPYTRRWHEQRWILDNIIQANGVDWDQTRAGGILRACGPEVTADIAAIKQRVKRFVDIASAFEDIGRKREEQAKAAETAGNKALMRDSHYIAALCYGQAMWPIFENNERLRALNRKKRESFSRYMQVADHRIEWAEIPYRGSTLPAVFHLPVGYQRGSKVPVVVLVPGMDGFKEKYVSLYNDPLLQRGIAVLAVEGPGYWEAPLRGLYVDVRGWQESGKEVMHWLLQRPEVDSSRIGMIASSYGSFFSAIMLSDEPRYKFCAVVGTCYEPGGETIFNSASITFKKRFMFMSGIVDEAAFDSFRKTLDWHAYAENIKTPYLVLAGGADQLCPIEYTDDFIKALAGPKQLVVYQDADHGVHGSPAAVNGPDVLQFRTDWVVARLSGTPVTSELWHVDFNGHISKSAL
jgi:alpha-beta hydrolase superfamily lysophospholipase